MKKQFFVIVVAIMLFGFNSAVFADESSQKPCPPGASACGDSFSMQGGINYTGIPAPPIVTENKNENNNINNNVLSNSSSAKTTEAEEPKKE